MESDHGHGRRGDRVHEGARRSRARQAVLRLLCARRRHAPHHPTKEWIKKISDMHLFDDGWNKLREHIFANQKRLGIVPQDTKLTPWPRNCQNGTR